MKDIKRMIEKSKESKIFFKRDPCNKNKEKKSSEPDANEDDESSMSMLK